MLDKTQDAQIVMRSTTARVQQENQRYNRTTEIKNVEVTDKQDNHEN